MNLQKIPGNQGMYRFSDYRPANPELFRQTSLRGQPHTLPDFLFDDELLQVRGDIGCQRLSGNPA